MNFDAIFTTYVAGLFVNLIAGLIIYVPIKKLLGWLPTSAQLHERFREVRTKRGANDKITALTPLLFISFYWLFVGNMIWALTDVIMEVLNWPDLVFQFLSDDSALRQFISERVQGLVMGRSLLFIMVSILIAKCFIQGLRIAKQCWDVYSAIEQKP